MGVRRIAWVVVSVLIGTLLSHGPAAPAAEPCAAGWIALTFDDGPGLRTAAVLDQLAALEAPGTFFVLGFKAAAFPDVVLRMAEAGHAVANHSFSHPYLTTLSSDAVRRQLRDGAAAIEQAGVTPVRVFRPPFGGINSRVAGVIAAEGWTTVMWTIDPQDWRLQSAGSISRHVLARLHDQAVVLFHDGGPTNSAAALPAIVTGARAAGYCLGVLADDGTIAPPFEPEESLTVRLPMRRIAGTDRVATSIALAAAFEPGVPVLYVATGIDFPDGLSAGAAAGATGGPLLLVTTAGLTEELRAEVTRLAPEAIVVVGGTAAVPERISGELAAYAPATRLAGADRYGTAAAVAAHAFPDGAGLVFVAGGRAPADAAVAGAAAARLGAPVLLTGPDRLPAATAAALRRLEPDRIVVVGGSGIVGDTVVATLAETAPVTRLAGSDRYATAALVSAWAFPGGAPAVLLASGSEFADALAAAPAAARSGAPVLLVSRTGVPVATAREIVRLDPGSIDIVGGSGAVPSRVFAAAAAFLEE